MIAPPDGWLHYEQDLCILGGQKQVYKEEIYRADIGDADKGWINYFEFLKTNSSDIPVL